MMIFHIPKRNTKMSIPVWTSDFLCYKYSKLQACVIVERTCLDGLGVGQQIYTMRIYYIVQPKLWSHNPCSERATGTVSTRMDSFVYSILLV